MIRHAYNDERNDIFELWSNSFDDINYINYFFNELYDDCETYVLVLDNEIVSCLSLKKHALQLGKHLLGCSMIIGLCTKPKYRNLGYMHELLITILKMLEHRELITLIETEKLNAYKEFGFESFGYRKDYYLISASLPLIKHGIIKNEIDINDYYYLYGHYASNFDYYLRKDKNELIQYLKELKATNGQVIAYYDKDGIAGFISFYIGNKKVLVEECLYLNTYALETMITSLSEYGEEILLSLNINEKPERYLPYLTNFSERIETYARLNRADLLSELYGYQVNSISDLLGINSYIGFIRANV